VVTLATDGVEVTVTTLSGSYKLLGGPAEDFPALPAVEVSEAVCVAFEPAVLVAASTDEAKQMLTGINVSITSGTITQAATDGHRLSMRSYATEAGDMAFTIPARAIRRIEGNVLLAIDKQQAAMVTADGTTITSRLIDGTYPNVQQLIPTSYEHTLTCERKQLLHALERVAVIGDIIKLTAAKQLTITAETDAGSGAESLAATGTLPPCAFNASYLIDGLKGLPGDAVTISANGPTTPVVLTPTGIDGVTYLVMPVQIRNQGFIGAVMEPTGPLIRDIWQNDFDDFLESYDIPYTFRASPLPEYVLHLPLGDTKILCRSFENWTRIIGLNLAWVLADEIDTVAPSIASRAFPKILGRLRVWQHQAVWRCIHTRRLSLDVQYLRQ
jgi:DNA polymerase III beta subunit